MKKIFTFVLFIIISFNCFSQQVVKVTEDCDIYDKNMNIINVIKKNENVTISRYNFKYLKNGNKFNYYASLNDDDETYIESSKISFTYETDLFDETIISKPGDCYFLTEYFDSLKQKNKAIVYDCYSKYINENLNDYDYSDWTRGVAFYQNNSYLMNLRFAFSGYYISFDGNIKEISRNNNIYKIVVSNYYYESVYQKRNINKLLHNIGQTETFYLKVDGDYLSFYLSDGKTLIQTFVRTNEETKNEFEKLLKTGKYDETKIKWPRHADGTCDYDGSSTAKKTNLSSTNVSVNKQMSVTENLKLRSGEATTTSVLTVMQAGTKVKVLELGKAENIGGIKSNWVKVEIISGNDRDGNKLKSGMTGWCYGGYLE